ncbi:MAG: cache domain-containing protein [Helicobacteraceae bacterium]|nr:cache domain-containing protein [Helicobacteraceae bacterium]
MNLLKKYKQFFVLGMLLSIVMLVLLGLYFMRSAAIEKEYKERQNNLIKEYIDHKKERVTSVIHTLKENFHQENKLVEEEATYELKKKVDHAYETAHLIYDKYKKLKSKKDIQERIIESVRYGGACDEEKSLFISNFDANSVFAQKPESIYEALDVDADGRTIALEMIQKVRKYSETYIYTNTNQKTRELIYAKNLDLYDWFVGASIDLTQRYAQKKQAFLANLGALPLSQRDFFALYDKNKEHFVEKKVGEKFDDRFVDAVTSNLLKKSTWYANSIDSNYYYSDYIESLDLYIIYGFDMKKLFQK